MAFNLPGRHSLGIPGSLPPRGRQEPSTRARQPGPAPYFPDEDDDDDDGEELYVSRIDQAYRHHDQAYRDIDQDSDDAGAVSSSRYRRDTSSSTADDDHEMDVEPDAAWPGVKSSLPPISRVFEPISRDSLAHNLESGFQLPEHFEPSYLLGSVYMQRLREAVSARTLERRERAAAERAASGPAADCTGSGPVAGARAGAGPVITTTATTITTHHQPMQQPQSHSIIPGQPQHRNSDLSYHGQDESLQQHQQHQQHQPQPPHTRHANPSHPIAFPAQPPGYTAQHPAMAPSAASSNLKVTTTSAAGSGPGPGFHRGVSHTIVERTPSHEMRGPIVAPLPSRWNKETGCTVVDIQNDGLTFRHVGHRNPPDRDQEAWAIRANHPMPSESGLYYFEITVLTSKAEDQNSVNSTIAIGFSTKKVSLARQPGWEPESWGYHGDDGRCFVGSNVGKSFGGRFGVGDIIGCGVNFRLGTAFFTKNGNLIGVASQEVRGELKLYPSVGFKKAGESGRANFGQWPFAYNIDMHMVLEKESVREQIFKASPSKLAHPLNETEFIQALVLQFLQHDGYVDTARALSQEIRDQKKALSLDPTFVVDGVNVKDDEDARNRQLIRKAVLEGNIDKVLDYTARFYPGVLEQNPQVYFRLRCRKFIEMVHVVADLSAAAAASNTTGKQISKSAYRPVYPDGHHQDCSWENMEVEGLAPASDPENVSELEAEMLQYGQALRADYKNDRTPEVAQALGEIGSLLAYASPLQVPHVAHLLSKDSRVAVAEELNSVILEFIGKSSRPGLEKVWAQTSVLLEELREAGGPGAFVSIQDVTREMTYC